MNAPSLIRGLVLAGGSTAIAAVAFAALTVVLAPLVAVEGITVLLGGIAVVDLEIGRAHV